MAIDPQKEALYAEITRRAGLYTQMLTLQRNGAPADQIDVAIAAIGIAEAEIRRMSDEINDSVWYKNYGKMMGLLEGQAEYFPQLLAEQKETHGSVIALSGRFQTVETRVGALEQRIDTIEARNEEMDSMRVQLARLETRLTKLDGGGDDN